MSQLENLFGKTAQLTVLEYLIKKRGEINYLSGIAEGTGLYHSSVARVIDPLLENNIVMNSSKNRVINPRAASRTRRSHYLLPRLDK